jgi:hypothetical protein
LNLFGGTCKALQEANKERSADSMSSSENISSPESISSSGRANSVVRVLVFDVLALAGAGLLLYTWFQQWWVAYIDELQQNGVVIYPHAMIISGTLRDYPQWIVGAEMPAWFFRLMWVYMLTCIAAILIGLFVGGERLNLGKVKLSWSQVLVGFAGLAYIVFVVVFPIVISIRAPQFHGVPLQGNVFISMDEHTESYVITSLQTGYWIACVVGPFLLALAILREKIVGKPTLDA